MDGIANNYKVFMITVTQIFITHCRARDLRDGTSFVALKKIRMKLTEEGVPLSALREIAILRRMDKYEHPNIVRYINTAPYSFLILSSLVKKDSS